MNKRELTIRVQLDYPQFIATYRSNRRSYIIRAKLLGEKWRCFVHEALENSHHQYSLVGRKVWVNDVPILNRMKRIGRELENIQSGSQHELVIKDAIRQFEDGNEVW